MTRADRRPASSCGSVSAALDRLNERQRRFVEAYIRDPNATRAAIKAGYKTRSAGSQGHDLLKKPEICVALAAMRADLSRVCKIDRERVIAELGRIAFGGMGALLRVDENGCPALALDSASRDDLDLIRSFSWKKTGRTERFSLRLADRVQALNLLAQIFGLFDQERVPERADSLALLLEEISKRGSKAPIMPGPGPGGAEGPDSPFEELAWLRRENGRLRQELDRLKAERGASDAEASRPASA